jgi:rubrerythrin
LSNQENLSTNNLHILEVCCKIEEGCSQLYHYLSLLFKDDPKVSALWDKTAKEEDNHAEQFRFACRTKGRGIEILKIDTQKADTILSRIQSIYDAVKKTPPTIKDALDIAIRLEQGMADYHMYAVAIFKDENMEQLFKAMMRYDNQHIEMLEKALVELSHA